MREKRGHPARQDQQCKEKEGKGKDYFMIVSSSKSQSRLDSVITLLDENRERLLPKVRSPSPPMLSFRIQETCKKKEEINHDFSLEVWQELSTVFLLLLSPNFLRL